MKKLYLPLLLALALYGMAAWHQIDLPGLHHDEAQEAGLMAMQIETGLPVTLFRGVGVVAFERTWPIMVQDYIGALNVYLAWFAFGIGGVSVESLRMMTVLMGMATLITAFGAARQLAGNRAGVLTALLLAVHPTFIFWTRQGVFVTSYILPLALGSLWLLARWWQGGRAWNLWLAAFLMGIGLWGKLLFVWFMGAIFLAWLLVNLPQLTRLKSIFTPAYALPIAILCGLLGLVPLIDYNLRSSGTFDSIFNNLDQSYYGVDNANFSDNVQVRWEQAGTVIRSEHMWELGGQFNNPFSQTWLFLAGLISVGAAIVLREKRGVRLFLPLVVILMVIQSSFTNTALWFTHFALILPFMLMCGAVGSLAALDVLKKYLPKHAAIVIIGGILALVMANDLLTTSLYHDALAKSGGLGPQSAAIYELVAELETLPAAHPVAALDWGISPAVEMLTEAHVVPNEVFGYSSLVEADAGFSARLEPFLALDESLYILHVPHETVFQRREAFMQAVSEANRQPLLVTVINNMAGEPFFEIWRTASR